MRWLPLALLALAACEREPKVPTTVALNETVPALAEPPPRVATQAKPGRDAVVSEQSAIPEIAGLAIAAGAWRAGADATRFVTPAGPLFEIACDHPNRTIILRRSGATGDIQILADRGANLFSATIESGTAVARFPASYPWFADVLAKAQGAFGVRSGGGVPLVLPADASIARILQRCR